jgi:hypothetical protein
MAWFNHTIEFLHDRGCYGYLEVIIDVSHDGDVDFYAMAEQPYHLNYPIKYGHPMYEACRDALKDELLKDVIVRYEEIAQKDRELYFKELFAIGATVK